METCETEVSVVVEPTPANHYHIGSVTATTPTTGGAPTVTDNDNGTYTDNRNTTTICKLWWKFNVNKHGSNRFDIRNRTKKNWTKVLIL